LGEQFTPDISDFLLYTTDDGGSEIEVRLIDETVWLSLDQMAELFQRDKSVVSRHIRNVFSEGELVSDRTVAKFATVRSGGNRSVQRDVAYYNLDVIISVGYRVKSHRGTQFRIWATQRLREYLIKGFTMNDDLLKRAGGGNYFEELLERIRDIRSSEKVFWKKVLDIFSTSIDYDPNSEISRQFFATVQNKMHFAAHGQTAAEVIFARADGSLPNMGMQTWTGRCPTKREAAIAKNYLNESELSILNRIVALCLDFAELQALNRGPVYMRDWLHKIDGFLQLSGREILQDNGTVSRTEAIEKAHVEFEQYRQTRNSETSPVESQFQEAVAEIRRLEAGDI
jgi:hypothetical protein